LPNVRWLIALITSVHRFLYRATGGWIGARAPGIRMLLLEHVGRRSGLRRVTPLLYVEHEGDLIVVASNAGDDRAPGWWYNLLAEPKVSLQVGRRRLEAVARPAAPEERQALWSLLDQSYRFYEDYRSRSSREIPIVILEPQRGVS
jgi:deazaflavin-dependent oxidoreductase (nitroreductase family)